MYDPAIAQPMREELTEVGFKELLTPDSVDKELKTFEGTALVFVNSVCGCAAGGARPALRMAVAKASKKPEKLLTVFAGMEAEATQRARSYFVGYRPSSPMMALMKDGEVVFAIERHNIEGQMPDAIARSLMAAFEEYC
ncbi:MAG: BrxA/BrxB family bacilliredoxin [Candidatus Sumerlaeia bacterium]|nr:BrxA/BrxB family bacilliredoxin [Candidatus Sumerlaeia bacterium]